MQTTFNLSDYLKDGIEALLVNILRASFSNPRESIFMAQFIKSSRLAQKKRTLSAQKGLPIPGFLIASITSRCNLACSGCYAHANETRTDIEHREPLSNKRWAEIFKEAKDLGVSFILLAGGEPFMRREILVEAAKIKEILFPIFTNGTLMNESYIKFLDQNRNLIPLLSLEGNKQQTDDRRSEGIYDNLIVTMDMLTHKRILFGVSITLTKANLQDVTIQSFIEQLYFKGCKAVIFVEYVPMNEENKPLAPDNFDREILENRLSELRKRFEDIIFLSFPGDEKASDGCLAAGRGFFHISVDGAAEPCPFSPHSDTSLQDVSLQEALASPLFKKLNDKGLLLNNHSGGCLLVEKDLEVRNLARGEI